MNLFLDKTNESPHKGIEMVWEKLAIFPTHSCLALSGQYNKHVRNE